LTSSIETIVADLWDSSKMEIGILVSLVVAPSTVVALDKWVGFLPLMVVACLEHKLDLLVSSMVLVEEQT